jgi:hypothetical protein
MITRAILQQLAIAKAKVGNQTRVGSRHSVSLEVFLRLRVALQIATNKPFVAFADNPCFAASRSNVEEQ